MKKVLYDEQSQPCISQNGRYMLFSAVKQTENVIFEIEKVKLEKDNGNISCRLVNSEGQTNFTLVINVFGKYTLFVFSCPLIQRRGSYFGDF